MAQLQDEDVGIQVFDAALVNIGPPSLAGRESPQKDVVPPSPSKEPVLLKSNLHKKGKRFKGWHQRYFEIQGKHMYYYKNHAKTDCLGEIDLSLCVHCAETNEATFGAPFEIQTTLRTHVLSARSHAERAQWIRTINSQMGAESATITRTKPKRWKTFKNAFRRKSRSAAAGTKARKSIMDRFRFRRHNAPPPLKMREQSSSNEPQLANRPLSLNENEVPQDTLKALVDTLPSHSLPATPLTKKKLDQLSISPPESPTYNDPAVTPSPVDVGIIPTIEIGVKDPNVISSDQPSLDVHNTTAKESVSTVKVEQSSSKEVEKLKQQEYIWDKIREVLQEADNDDMSYNTLPEENQEWMQHSSGIEQLRAFLAVCD